MKLNTALQIEKCAAVKDIRAYLNAPYLDAEKARIVATDGHKAVIVPVELEPGDTSGPIAPDAFKTARKLKADSIQANGNLTIAGHTMPRPDLDGLKYPDIERVLPSGEPVLTVSFNAEYLLQLARALSDKKAPVVRLEFTAAENVIRVTADDSGAFGLLMPCRM